MNTIVKKAAGLGAIAGMRASVAPSVTSHFLSMHPSAALANSKLSFIQTSTAALVTKLLNAAEIIGDKLPATPNRTTLAQTLPRVTSGAFVGAVIFRANRESVLKGALIGGAAALAATYASFYARQYLDKIPYVKDPLVGILEDVLAIKGAASLLQE